MAALSIAFEAPDNCRAGAPAERPIDLVHLARQTMGNKAVEDEVLAIFARQARTALNELSQGDADLARLAAHRLKGAALSVGAREIATLAESLEADPADATCVARLAAAVVKAENFIQKLMR